MTGRQVDGVGVRQPIVGTVDEVAAAVRAARATGRLESMTRPRLVPDGSGRAYVHIVMRDEPAPPVRRWPVVAGCVVLAASGTVTVLAVVWVVDHWAQILGAGLVALVLMVAVNRIRP